MRWVVTCVALLLGACVGPQAVTQTVVPAPDTAVVEKPVEAVSPGPTRLWRNFNVGSEGRGTRRVGAVSVAGNVGTVMVDDKELQGFVYEVQDWAEYGYVLYDVLAVDESGYYVFYLYCRDDKLTDIYWESYWDDLEYEKAVGTCSRTQTPTEAHVSFGPVKIPDGLVAGYTIDSKRLSLAADGTGSVELLGNRYDIYAFSYVGCAECNAGQQRGWEELHVLLDTPDEDCFAILYLFGDENGGDRVQLGYGFCTVPVKDLPSTVFPAPWKRLPATQPPPSTQGR
jgi:hypothetical protein